jgi:signal transduction histidine kinase
MKEKDRLAALGEMAAGLAHEIRNPLGAIKGAAQYLSPENLPAENNEFLQIIVDEVNRLNSVVSHFLDYSRPLKQNFVPVELSNVICRTAKLLSSDLPENVVLKIDVRENLPKVSADAEQLKQVLINLIQNAVQAMPEGGTITLTVRSPDSIPGWRFASAPETVEIRVLDTGNGIPEEARPHIFVPFYTTKEQGTGLGLAICDRIVKSHGGSIMISSRIGEGTEFIIRLPAIPEPRIVVDSKVTSSPGNVNISEIDLTPFPGTLMPPEGARGKKKKKNIQRR